MEYFKGSRTLLISEVIINKCIDRKISLNTSKLIKLLYLMNLEHIKRYNSELLDSKISFTENGPMIEDVYNHFKFGSLGFDSKVEQNIQLKDTHETVANKILDIYGNYKPHELALITKKEPLSLILKNHTKI